MKYLSNNAIRNAIIEMMEPQGIGENELAEMLDMSEEEVMTFLSDGHDFTVSEICSILMALDLDMRFEIVPF